METLACDFSNALIFLLLLWKLTQFSENNNEDNLTFNLWAQFGNIPEVAAVSIRSHFSVFISMWQAAIYNYKTEFPTKVTCPPIYI